MLATYQPTDLASFSTEIASSFRSAVEKAGMTLTLHCQPLPEPVFIDRDMLEKVLLNLLSWMCDVGDDVVQELQTRRFRWL